MRRLARSLFTLSAAASLLLYLATCGLWLRSYRVSDQLSWMIAGDGYSLSTATGSLNITLVLTDASGRPRFHRPTYSSSFPLPPWRFFRSPETDTEDQSWSWRGLAWYETWNTRLDFHDIQIFISFWWIAAGTAALLVAWLVARRRLRRARSLSAAP